MTQRGPKTPGGRAAVRHNALSHGLRSQSPIIPGESQEEWEQHLAGVIESLQPVGHLEEQFATLIALGLWRRWRIERYEIASITAHMDAAGKDLQIAQAYAEGSLSKGIRPQTSRLVNSGIRA